MLGMLAAMACFVLNDAFVKLVGPKLPAPQIISLRGLFAFAIVLPIAAYFGVLRQVPRLVHLWGEVPDRLAIVGVIIVTAAGLYTFHRERKLKAKEQAMQSAAAGGAA